MNTDQLVKVAKALADPTRHRMLQRIRAGGQLTCSQVCACFPLSQPTISHHIKLLVEAGLVVPRKDGQFCVLKADERAISRYAAAIGVQPPAADVDGAAPPEQPRPRRRPASGGAPAAAPAKARRTR